MCGVVLFLSIFSGSNIFGEILKTYEINLFGPIGMVIFLGLLSFMIVKYQIFNIKLIATQALVWSLVILIGSQFFFIKVLTNFILTGATFVASIVLGYFLIKSVKKEIQQKEALERLNISLQSLIKQRESLMHLINHKVKSSFTHSKYIFAGLLDGTFGEVNEEVKKRAGQGFEANEVGIKTIDLILNITNMQKGLIKYDLKKLDFRDIVLKVFSEKKITAEKKGLKIEKDIVENGYYVSGDAFWLQEAVNNLIDNSIKYTKQGGIKVELKKSDGKVILSVKDTGIGLTFEDKENLFLEGGRGKNALRTNVESTGYGLYSVKLIIEAHKGRVWAESEGENKGSTFFIELPVTL